MTDDKPERLLSGTLLLIAAATFAAVFGHQVLFSVVPLFVDEIGGGSSGAGAANGLYLLATVLTQVQMPRLLPRFGYGRMLFCGMLLLGPPAFFYGAAQGLLPVLAVSLFRGVGFGIVTVVVFALIAEVAPPGRLGEALGIVLVAVMVPTVFCSALGLWLAENAGFPPVFVVGAAMPLLGAVCVVFIRSVPVPVRRPDGGFLAGLSRAPLFRLVAIFSAATVCSGVFFTFLPISASGSGPFSATGALLFLAVSTTFFRWWGGRMSDRYGPSTLLAPGLLVAAGGAVLLAAEGLSLLLGAVLFGAGFGVLQNATLVMMMSRVGKEEYGLGSTLWNVAFDGGAGAGAFVFGFLIPLSGFFLAYVLCAALLVCAVFVVSLDKKRTGEVTRA